ncbi:protein neprosin-like [Aristolochia californica]|uniref:protein neprosin-like n=1 Tax=Aristolochia californica TaxID=171875 RepID=UPI0035D80665
MIGLPDGGCPEGYIPIRRTTKNELVKAKIFFNYNREVITPTAKPPYAGNVAILKWRGKEKAYGTRFALNVWGLQVDKGQFSASNVWILHGCDFINAGWIVNPDLFGDSKSRLFINWTVDCYKKTGCFNMFCPGFVQIDTEFPLGTELRPLSVHNGPQYKVKLDLFKDLSSGGDWWLVHGGDKPIGYWPSELLTNLSSYSEAMAWGGYVYGPTDRPSPAMGSGYFPYEGYGVGCFFRGIKLMDMYRAFYTPRDKYLSHAHTRCYGLETGSIGNKDWGLFVYFGGPTCRPL